MRLSKAQNSEKPFWILNCNIFVVQTFPPCAVTYVTHYVTHYANCIFAQFKLE